MSPDSTSAGSKTSLNMYMYVCKDYNKFHVKIRSINKRCKFQTTSFEFSGKYTKDPKNWAEVTFIF